VKVVNNLHSEILAKTAAYEQLGHSIPQKTQAALERADQERSRLFDSAKQGMVRQINAGM
jgi:hypothetical protein